MSIHLTARGYNLSRNHRLKCFSHHMFFYLFKPGLTSGRLIGVFRCTVLTHFLQCSRNHNFVHSPFQSQQYFYKSLPAKSNDPANTDYPTYRDVSDDHQNLVNAKLYDIVPYRGEGCTKGL